MLQWYFLPSLSMASKTTMAIYSSLIRQVAFRTKMNILFSEGKNTQIVFMLCTHSVLCWKTLLSCYHKRIREQLPEYLALTSLGSDWMCLKGLRRAVTIKEAVIQLEQLLRCNKEEEGRSKWEGAVLEKFGRWRTMALQTSEEEEEVSPQQLHLYLDTFLSWAQLRAAVLYRTWVWIQGQAEWWTV